MILIIGGTGNIGTPLLRLLLDARAEVRVLVHAPESAAKLPEGVNSLEGDLLDVVSLERAMRGVDTVFLLSPVHPDLVRWQANAVEAAGRAGVRRIVKASTLDASAAASPRLLRMHAEAEEVVRASGLRFTFVRPNFLMQNLLMDAASVRAQGAIYGCLGDSGVSYVDARDVAAIAASALLGQGHDGKVFDATGPAAVTHPEIADALSRLLAKSIQVVDMPAKSYREMLGQVGMPAWGADTYCELLDHARRGEASKVSTHQQELTGGVARSLDAFLTEFAAAFR